MCGDRGDGRIGLAHDDGGFELGGARRDLGDAAGEVALDDHDASTGVGELVAQELTLVGGVDRHGDGAEPQGREGT